MPKPANRRIALKGTVFHFLGDPFQEPEEKSYELIENGLLSIEDGYITQKGRADELEAQLPEDTTIIDHGDNILLPGFVDTHLHYPQTDIIASYGKQLLEWLQTYTFPCEARFDNPEIAETTTTFFLEELLRNGTTTAQVMPTIHSRSVDAFFRQCQEANFRMICGKVMMDRNAPDYLLDTPETGFDQSLELIEKWHGKARLLYAVTPRFAVTSTEAQLKKCAELLASAPGLYLHTHLSESLDEIRLISELFPWSNHYLDVYDKFGLVTERSVFAHCVHLNEEELKRLSNSHSAISFCPTSNLFIGSGLFDMDRTVAFDLKTGIGTDVGGGTSFSMLKTLAEAYKVLQLQNQTLSPVKAFYLATLGGAKSLMLDQKIGNFEIGKEADITVLNLDATPLIQRRMDSASTVQEKLFILMMLGDDRSIDSTYLMGRRRYHQTP